jgi:hypothetical protein
MRHYGNVIWFYKECKDWNAVLVAQLLLTTYSSFCHLLYIMRENTSRIHTLMKVPEVSCSPSFALFYVYLRNLGLLHVIDYTWLNFIVYIWK